jgi:hypothetical protein
MRKAKINTALFLTIIIAFIFFSNSQVYSTTADKDIRRDKVKEEIWALEEAYFANLYKANYKVVLAIAHSQFLGWPDAVSQPVDKEESARFMKDLIPSPTSCTFKIERAGIRLLHDVALTQYTILVTCDEAPAARKTQSSRITHTWVKESGRWKLLGGMSCDKPIK